MAEFSLPYVLVTPGGTITFNSGDPVLWLSAVTGLDGAPLRTPIDNKPQAHGGLVHRFLLGPRHITVEGVVHCPSAVDEAAYVAARQSTIQTLANALLSCIAADGQLSWTPSGGSALHLNVRHDQPLAVTGGWMKEFVFGLVAADPTPY